MWYALQITVFSTITYYYVTDITPQAPIGAVMLEATLLTYGVTWILSKTIDATRNLLTRQGSLPLGRSKKFHKSAQISRRSLTRLP